MSVEASCWAWKQAIPSGPKLVLLCLADHADRSGVCWPGQSEVAEKCCMNRATVNQHIGKLENLYHLIEERKRCDRAGHRITSLYLLKLDVILNPNLGSSNVGTSNIGTDTGLKTKGYTYVAKPNVGNPHVGNIAPNVGISAGQSCKSQQLLEPSLNHQEPPTRHNAPADEPPTAPPTEPEPEPEPAPKPKSARKTNPKTPIPENWQPSARCWELIDEAGIPAEFAQQEIGEFVMYWTERQERRPGWDASFLSRVKSQWERRGANYLRSRSGNGTYNGNGNGRSRTAAERRAEVTDMLFDYALNGHPGDKRDDIH